MTDSYNININGTICNIIVTDREADANAALENGCILILLDSESLNTLDYPDCKWVIEDCSAITQDFLEKVCRRHLKLPWHIADTARCTIREFCEAELPFLDSRLLLDIPSPDEYIRTMYHMCGFGYWLVIDKETDTIVGKVGFGTDTHFNDIHLGYSILPAFRKKGYAYEACLAAINYGFNELCLDQIAIHIKADNLPSLQLAKKLGFIMNTDPSDTAYLSGYLVPHL